MNDLYLTTTNDMHYKIVGTGPVIVLLHGWGQNLTTFEELASNIACKCILVDLMGFGMSDEPDLPRCVDDYVDDLEELVRVLQLNDFILLGHSFGGRVAIKYAKKHPEVLRHLVLVNSAGIKHHSIKYHLNIIKYKIKKMWLKTTSFNKYQQFVSNSGSDDYRNASYVMRGTLKKVVKEDLKKAMKRITVPTTIIAGYYDYLVRIEDKILMHKLIPNSKLYVFYKSGHFSYLDEKEKFVKLLKKIIVSKLGDKNERDN